MYGACSIMNKLEFEFCEIYGNSQLMDCNSTFYYAAYSKDKPLLSVATSASTSAKHTTHGNGATPQSCDMGLRNGGLQDGRIRADTLPEGKLHTIVGAQRPKLTHRW